MSLLSTSLCVCPQQGGRAVARASKLPLRMLIWRSLCSGNRISTPIPSCSYFRPQHTSHLCTIFQLNNVQYLYTWTLVRSVLLISGFRQAFSMRVAWLVKSHFHYNAAILPAYLYPKQTCASTLAIRLDTPQKMRTHALRPQKLVAHPITVSIN